MTGPAITVGLPVYNGENYLAEAIDSIREQSFADYLLIIADNASTDATEEIARAAAESDSRIVYVRHPQNMGAAANYNYTVDRAQGDYFIWQAHDDLRAPDFLEMAFEALEQSKHASVAFSRATIIGPEGEPGEIMPRPDDLLSPLPDRRLKAAIVSKHPDVVLFGLMRRSMLLETGKHGSFKGGDRLLVAEMALLGPFIELPEVLFFNRDHPNRYVRMSDDEGKGGLKSVWWDPESAGRVSMPRWRGLIGYLRAVGSHPLPLSQRLRAYVAIAESLFFNRMYILKQLARDVVLALARLVPRRSPGQ